MKQKLFKPIIFIIAVLFFNTAFCQDLFLKISSTEKKNEEILKTCKHKINHKDTTTLYREINSISNFLKNKGYFLNSVDSVRKEKKNFIAYFSLNQKIDSAHLFVPSNLSYLFNNTSKKIKVPVNEVNRILLNISTKLGNDGKSFSKVRLKNISIEDKIIFADLDIHQSKKRIFNKIIVRGYKDFPKKYIRNHFNVDKKTTFNSKKIKEISNLSKEIEFIEEIKPPEILFTKDSTLLYIYLKKKQNNSFDGIVNFTSKEKEGILFNGNLDLKFNNIFNKGERLHLFWNSIGEERQEFKFSTSTNYIFNTKFSPKISFSIYRQDSTFFNTKFTSDLFFNINKRTKVAVIYNSESSENLKNRLDSNIESFKNYFLGFKFQYKTTNPSSFFKNIFFLEINPTFGKRTTNQNSLNQFKIESSSSYLWSLTNRSNIYIKNKTGFLNSKNFLNNEIFRIGGANSIRGFNEQSIFTNNFTYFNTEYRYLGSNTSYLYTITDIAFTNPNTYFGFGFGYGFKTKNSLVNISIAVGKEKSKELTFNNSKFIINWINYF